LALFSTALTTPTNRDAFVVDFQLIIDRREIEVKALTMMNMRVGVGLSRCAVCHARSKRQYRFIPS
jgi:hypothetical protein